MKTLIILFLLALTACNQSGKTDENIINVYTHRHYDTDEILYQQFTEQTGIKVNLVKATADELIARLENEGANTQADLIVTIDAARLYLAKEKGLLEKVESDILKSNIPSAYRDSENFWFAITKRARAIVASVDRVPVGTINSYMDLTDAKWKGKIVSRSSSHTYNQSLMAAFLAKDEDGQYAQTWAEGVADNLAYSPKGNDRDQIKAIAAGQADIALVNTYYICKLITSDDSQEQLAASKVYVIYPNEGTHINISGIGLVKHSKNKENAIKFMEFLSSEAAQKYFTDVNYEYPVNPNVTPADLLIELGEFTEENIDLNLLGKYNSQALMVFDRAGWK